MNCPIKHTVLSKVSTKNVPKEQKILQKGTVFSNRYFRRLQLHTRAVERQKITNKYHGQYRNLVISAVLQKQSLLIFKTAEDRA